MATSPIQPLPRKSKATIRPKDGMTTLYMATNRINGKRYIGVTMGYLSQRIAKHVHLAITKNGKYSFCKAIRKYGKDAFVFETLGKYQHYGDAAAAEAELVAKLRPEYNEAPGGLGNPGWKHSDASRAKMSEANKGRPGYWTGKKLLPHIGKLVTERNMKPHRRERWRQIIGLGHLKSSRPVVCLDDGREFPSVAAAALAYGADPSMLSSVCRKGRHRTVRGCVFRFLGEHHGGKDEADAVRQSVLDNRLRCAAIARGTKRS